MSYRHAFGAFALALLSAAAPASAASLPGVPQIQSAYEAAYIATRGKPPGEHADDLVIQTARCQVLQPRQSSLPSSPSADTPAAACQIEFVRRREPDGRLYADIVTLAAAENGDWALVAGLCMTRPADKHKASAWQTSATTR